MSECPGHAELTRGCQECEIERLTADLAVARASPECPSCLAKEEPGVVRRMPMAHGCEPDPSVTLSLDQVAQIREALRTGRLAADHTYECGAQSAESGCRCGAKRARRMIDDALALLDGLAPEEK